MPFGCFQLRGEAPEERRIKSMRAGKHFGITHNLGGRPGECVTSVVVVGNEPG